MVRRIKIRSAAEYQIVAMPEGFFENRFPVLSFPNIDCLTANDKDFSLRSK